MTSAKCKCTMSISVLGDGCRYCQPQEYIDRITEDFKEIDSENDFLRESFETFVEKSKLFLVKQGINPCEWASYRNATKALDK